MNWGAFAGGVADGYTDAEKLRLAKEANDRQKEEFEHNKNMWERQDRLHATLDAAPNTFAPDADLTQAMSPEDYKTKFKAPAPDKKGVGAWIEKQFGGGADKTAAPVAKGAFGAAGGAEAAPTLDAGTTPKPVAKAPGKDDYVPVIKDDGSIVYAPRTAVKQLEGPALYARVGKAISQFDPAVGMSMMKGAQELESGVYKLKAQAIEKAVMDAGRMWATDPQGALDAISNSHTMVPDGQQVKLTYDPKSGKIQSQFFAETKKGLIPMGKPETTTWENVFRSALSYGSPENYYKNLELTYAQSHRMATEMNQRAGLANEARRLRIAENTDARAEERAAAQNDYLRARTKALEGKVGEGWKPVIRDDPDGSGVPLTGRSNPKTGETQWQDNEWGKFVKPRFMGTYKQITEAAQSKGLMAKVGADGNVYYINPKTNVASTNIEDALKVAAPRSPANGSAQVPPPSF